METAENHSREAFQLERLILFSDAVFAIAITLLVIEIKVPELHGEEATEAALLRAVGHLIPKFAGFIASFVLIAMYWRIHHRLFGHVVRQTPALIRLNLLFLFAIVLMPFSTGMFGEYSGPATMHLKTPLFFYVGNIALAGLFNFFLWRYVGEPANGVADGRLDAATLRSSLQRAVIVPSVFLLAIPIAYVSPLLARYAPLLIPVMLRLTRPKPR